MEIQHEDRVLHFENHLSKRKKRLARSAAGSNPDVIMSGGQPMVKTSAMPKKKKKKGLFKKIALAVATGGASEIVRNRKKIGKGLAKGAKAVGKAVKKVTQMSLLAPLIPLMPVMRKALKKKGLSPPKDPVKLAEMFHKVIVLKRSTFDPDPFPHYENHVAPIVAIIPPIINFVKNIIKNKKKGAKLPPEENAIATEAENVINEVAKEEGKLMGTQGEMRPNSPITEVDPREPANPGDLKNIDGSINFKSPWVIGGIVAVLIAVFLLVRKR